MNTKHRSFTKGITDNGWFKKGHKLSSESIEKMRKAKTKFTPEELKLREKERKNKPERIAWTKRYYKTPNRRFAIYKRSAEIKHIDFLLSLDEFLTFWQKPCSYCGDIVETIGLDRVDNNKSYKIDNLVSCCKFCNYMKRKMSPSKFLGQVEKIYLLNRKDS